MESTVHVLAAKRQLVGLPQTGRAGTAVVSGSIFAGEIFWSPRLPQDNRCGRRGSHRTLLVSGQEAFAAGAAFGAQAGAAFDFAGLLVEFANSHFLLDTAALDQLAETADGFLGRFLVA